MSEEERQMIADCEAREGKLSDWERGFIDSISAQQHLSAKQAAKLNDIWERITS